MAQNCAMTLRTGAKRKGSGNMSIESLMNEYELLQTQTKTGEQLDDLYADLMIRMEKAFEIPGIITGEWEQDNKPVSTLYRLIASSRLMKT